MNRYTKMKEVLIYGLLVGGVLLVVARDAKADFIFGTPTNLGPTVNSSSYDNDPIISPDGLELYFTSTRPGGAGSYDIWVTTRQTLQGPWGEPVNLPLPVNRPAGDGIGGISPDGLELYFISNRPGGSGSYDIWVTTRETIQDTWGDPVNLGSTVNSPAGDFAPRISADGLSLFFNSDRSGGYGSGDLWISTRPTVSDPWSEPVNLGSTVNSSSLDYSPAPSPDGLLLFFSSRRPGGYGDYDIWMTSRATIDDHWGAPVNLGPAVNSWSDQENPYISADGSTLFFGSTRPGGSGDSDLWQVSINPVVDFNGDGKVDLKDYSKLTQYWQQNECSVDMGPTPLGDGIVDCRDVVLLAEYWLTEPSLVAHWKLDETEGLIAHDSLADHDGTLHGDPVWQPSAGQIDGALELDGVDDYVGTDFVLSPGQRPLSVFLWVKGEVPGQVILSQAGGVNWFYTLSPMGWLMTNLGQHGAALLSQTVITDGQWHRIGFTWDWTNRTLYVDGVEVARDTQSGLAGSDGGLYFGAGKELESGSFFSGLIDDVKIYNRAIVP